MMSQLFQVKILTYLESKTLAGSKSAALHSVESDLQPIWDQLVLHKYKTARIFVPLGLQYQLSNQVHWSSVGFKFHFEKNREIFLKFTRSFENRKNLANLCTSFNLESFLTVRSFILKFAFRYH